MPILPPPAPAPATPSGATKNWIPLNRYSDKLGRKYGPAYTNRRQGLQSDMYSIISGGLVDPSGWRRNVLDPEAFEVNASGYINVQPSGFRRIIMDPIEYKINNSGFITQEHYYSFNVGDVTDTTEWQPIFAHMKTAKINRFTLMRGGPAPRDIAAAAGANWNVELAIVSGGDTPLTIANFHTAVGGWGRHGGNAAFAASGIVFPPVSAYMPVYVPSAFEKPNNPGPAAATSGVLALRCTKTGTPTPGENLSGLVVGVFYELVGPSGNS